MFAFWCEVDKDSETFGRWDLQEEQLKVEFL